MSAEDTNAGMEWYIFARDDNGIYKKKMIIKKTVSGTWDLSGSSYGSGGLLDENNIYVGTKTREVYFYPYRIFLREGKKMSGSDYLIRGKFHADKFSLTCSARKLEINFRAYLFSRTLTQAGRKPKASEQRGKINST